MKNTARLFFFILFVSRAFYAQSLDTYFFSSTQTQYSPISGSQNIIGPNIDDSLSEAKSIGFTFNYAGIEYDSFRVSTNGFMLLGTGGKNSYNSNDLANESITPVIAPLWDDLKTGKNNGKISYLVTGTLPDRILTIQFSSMSWDLQSSAENANFQIKLYETSNIIEFVYGAMGEVNNSSGGASIGLNDTTGGTVIFLSVTPADIPTASFVNANNSIESSSYLSTGLVYKFFPQVHNDISTDQILYPENNGAVNINSSFAPVVNFKNIGSSAQTEFPVLCAIYNSAGDMIYYSIKSVLYLDPLKDSTITFDTLKGGLKPDTYTIMAKSFLTNDENPVNDSLMTTFFVSWDQKGLMTVARRYHTATLLNDGKVLIAGGRTGSTLNTCELYDPETKKFTATGSMHTARYMHTASLLPNGKVLVTGGIGNYSVQYGGALSSCEIYDPDTEQWTVADSMLIARCFHTATVLKNGKVLIAGGDYTNDLSYTASCELFDPETETWKTVGSMKYRRAIHVANLLPNGMVLVAGNTTSGGSTCELYNPETATWQLTTPMNEERYMHQSVLLDDGRVLVVSGYIWSWKIYMTSCEIYDPATAKWTYTGSLPAGCTGFTLTKLTDGRVLLTGGYNGTTSVSDCYIYYYDSGTWQKTAAMEDTKHSHAATLLENGKVLITGGYSYNTVSHIFLNKSELYEYQEYISEVEDNETSIPAVFELSQNYPNPFNPSTKINYSIPKQSFVTITVYDVLGRKINTLVNEEKAAGNYTLEFNGGSLASGIYFYQIRTDEFSQIKKMLLLK